MQNKIRNSKRLYLGNLNARRDWGHARDFVEAMWKMLQKTPSDYVISTGEQYSVKDFVNLVLIELGIKFIGKGRELNQNVLPMTENV